MCGYRCSLKITISDKYLRSFYVLKVFVLSAIVFASEIYNLSKKLKNSQRKFLLDIDNLYLPFINLNIYIFEVMLKRSCHP